MANRKHYSILIRNGMNWFASNDPFHGWWFLLHLVAVMNLDCVSGWPFLYTHCRALNIITYFLMSPMCVNVLCVHVYVYKFGVRTGQAHVCTNPKEKFIFFFHNNRLPTVLYKRKPNKEKHIHTHTHARIHEIRLISMFIHGVLTIIKLLVVWSLYYGHLDIFHLLTLSRRE